MLNQFHDVKWSKEFGNAIGGNLDECPDAVISHDGFIVFVIGHAMDFTTLTFPTGTTDFYILQLKINDGALMKQKFSPGNGDDFFRAIRFHRNTIYAVGDTMSFYRWLPSQSNASPPPGLARSKTFILKVNCDLLEMSCLQTDYLATKAGIHTTSGHWDSDTKVFDFAFEDRSGQFGLTVITVWYMPAFDYALNPIVLDGRSLYDCQLAPFYDIQDSSDHYLASTLKAVSYQIYPFCHDMKLAIGINEVSFTNDSSKDLITKPNVYGYFFERAKNEINGVPKAPGEYGIRVAYIAPDGRGRG
jgi:hypothetical protein